MKNKRYFKRLIAFFTICAVVISCSAMQIYAATAEETNYKNQLKTEGFPDIYLEKLWNMHKAHPNWVFKAYNTDLDWDTAVEKESQPTKNLVYIQPLNFRLDSVLIKPYTSTRLYRSQSVGSYISKNEFEYVVRDGSNSNQNGWVDATPMAVAYYMNPYIFIGNEITIMQFESLEWNFGSDIDKAIAVVEAMLNNTFMSRIWSEEHSKYIDENGNIKYIDTSGRTVTTSETYAHAICTAAMENNINPCYLTSKILSEVGTNGSGTTTGTYSGYTGYYNYLNIGAYDNGSGGAVANGLAKAKANGWNTPQKSIAGGAAIIASDYIGRGQNTSYFQKFNVTSKNTYGHQYMTAVNGVVNTTYNTYAGYKRYGILDTQKTFYIPVFKNMPDATAKTVNFANYSTNAETGIINVNNAPLRSESSLAGANKGSVSVNTKVTVLGGYRDQRVAYDGSYDATFYRMYTPLWYNIKLSNGSSVYVREDYLDKNNTLTLKVGESKSLQFTTTAGSTETPRFISQDTRIAKVDKTGKVTAVGNGTTKVVVYLANGAFDVLNVTVSTSSPSSIPNAVTSSKYSVNDVNFYISKIPYSTTVNTFLSNINERSYVKITKDGKTLSSNDLITTGCTVSIMNGNTTVKSYTVVITGDISISNGCADGKVSITDLLAIRDELLSNTGRLAGANYQAADVNGDGKVSITDLLAIRDFLLGISGLTPRAY